jgi:DNA-binding MarR family transcriptional regulator
VDRRRVLVHVTPRGERLLSRLVRHRIAELRVTAPALTRALQAVLARRGGLRATSVQESQEARKRKSAGNAHRDNTTPLRQE